MKSKNNFSLKEIHAYKNKGKQNTNEILFFYDLKAKPDFQVPKFNRNGRIKK